MGFMFLVDEPENPPQKKTVDKEVENIKLKAVNRMLVAACHDALQLRGLMAALHDPLMLDGERKEKRERWKQIELSIRAAIERSEGVDNKSNKNAPKPIAGNNKKILPSDEDVEKYF